MNIVLFASDSKCFKYLNPIHKELVKNNHKSFFLYTEENTTQIPWQSMEHFNYSFNEDYNFESNIFSQTLNLPLPYIPDYLIIVREKWPPEQIILKEFKEKFKCKIVFIEVNSQFNNVIESRLEAISRTKPPQNEIDVIFDHSNFILNTRKQALDWDKLHNNSYVVGNPCYDDFDEEIDLTPIHLKYNVDKTKKQILFFSLINMDRPICLQLLENLAKKCGEDYQIFYKPFPGEPFRNEWRDEYHPKFIVDNVTVIYDHLDLFPMYKICDIHVGCISSVMYPSLLLNKKVVNLNNFCKYLDKGNDIELYKNETYSKGGADGSAKFWMRVHGLNTLKEFEDFVDLNKLEEFKKHNQHVKSLISEGTYNYDYDLNFLNDNSPKDYSKLLQIFDEYNDKKSCKRIVKKLEELL